LLNIKPLSSLLSGRKRGSWIFGDYALPCLAKTIARHGCSDFPAHSAPLPLMVKGDKPHKKIPETCRLGDYTKLFCQHSVGRLSGVCQRKKIYIKKTAYFSRF
jgi:hypothetical protein